MDSELKALKVEVARAALTLIESGMSIGLGTGSTAEEFVRLLGEKVNSRELERLRLTCTSEATERLARSVGLEIRTLDELQQVDLTIDGADEIDGALRLIKGRGGALLREKIVEQASRRFVVIADYTKVVERLGIGPLPVEVVKFAAGVLENRFRLMGLDPKFRMKDQQRLVTDEGHVILDVMIPKTRDIEEMDREIRRHAGVVETGFFPFEATEAIIGTPAGIVHRKRT